MAGYHKTHIDTKTGVAILIIALAIPITVLLSKQQTNTQQHASGTVSSTPQRATNQSSSIEAHSPGGITSNNLKPNAVATPPPISGNPSSSLQNSDFENGLTGWTSGGALTVSLNTDKNFVQSGNSSAILGSPSFTPACNNRSIPEGNAYVAQKLILPDASNLNLSFWYRIFTQDLLGGPPPRYDWFGVYVNSVDDAHRLFYDGNPATATITECKTPLDLGWKQKTLSLDSYRGQTVTLYFVSWNTATNAVPGGPQPQDFNTYTYLDNVSLSLPAQVPTASFVSPISTGSISQPLTFTAVIANATGIAGRLWGADILIAKDNGSHTAGTRITSSDIAGYNINNFNCSKTTSPNCIWYRISSPMSSPGTLIGIFRPLTPGTYTVMTDAIDLQNVACSGNPYTTYPIQTGPYNNGKPTIWTPCPSPAVVYVTVK